jgi:hypothetical protein
LAAYGAVARWLAAALVLVVLASCGVADQLSGHTLEYNAQAELIKDQNLLVNIVRAAYRRPLQFTDLSSITGNVSVSGTAAFALPFWGSRGGGQRLFEATPSITATNSPIYTVSVLNTKEFYNGILTPISIQSLSYYLHIGFPKLLLLTLLISEIEYGKPGAVTQINNAPHQRERSKQEANVFLDLLKRLIAMGLSVEDISETTRLGAPFGAKNYPDAKQVADLDAQNIRVVPLNGSRFQLEKVTSTLRFCFDPKDADENLDVRAGMKLGETGLVMPADLICGAKEKAQKGATAQNQVFDIHTHSTEGVIYYLGGIARLQLGLVPPATGDFDPDVFHLKEGSGGPGTISASFEGKDYHIDVDPTGTDRSSQVLELVTELLAQNNSAKDLPASSVISVSR